MGRYPSSINYACLFHSNPWTLTCQHRKNLGNFLRVQPRIIRKNLWNSWRVQPRIIRRNLGNSWRVQPRIKRILPSNSHTFPSNFSVLCLVQYLTWKTFNFLISQEGHLIVHLGSSSHAKLVSVLIINNHFLLEVFLIFPSLISKCNKLAFYFILFFGSIYTSYIICLFRALRRLD